jgi:hypothetical protein
METDNIFSLYLKIADINLQLNIQHKSDFLFLKNKYIDYFVEASRNNILIEVFFIDNLKKQSVKYKSENHFVISACSLSKNFGYFSDLFLQTFIEIINGQNGLIIHASTLHFKNKGYIFMGHSGAGKSTIRKICKSLESLSDDIAIVRLVKKNYYLYGSPFYQSTKKSYPNKKILIKGIFNIKQNKYTKVEKLIKYDAFVYLRHNVFRVENASLQNERIFSLIENVNIYNLDFEKNDIFWKLISCDDFDFLSKRNFKKILIKVNGGILNSFKTYNWIPILANREFVKNLNIINESSWNFEFDDERTVGSVTKRVRNKKYSGLHTEIIRKFIKNNSAENLVSICLKKNDDFEIIDGNHRTVANMINKNNCYYKIIYADRPE